MDADAGLEAWKRIFTEDPNEAMQYREFPHQEKLSEEERRFLRFRRVASLDFNKTEKALLEDPEKGERTRSDILEGLITFSDNVEMLRRIQWRIDQELMRHKVPSLGACIAVNRMLMDRVYGQGGFVDVVNALAALAKNNVEAAEALVEKKDGLVLLLK